MTFTTFQMMDAALVEASKHLMRAAGQDEKLSPREIRQKLNALSGEMRDLVEVLYAFVVEIDAQGANHITEKDIEAAVARVKKEIFPNYAVSELVLGETEQNTVKAIAPKNALRLALQLYQTARSSQILPAVQVFEQIHGLTKDLFFDYLGSEGSMPLEAVHIPVNLVQLTQESVAQALGLDQDKPAEFIERYREADSFFPVFVRQHADFGLDQQAQALSNLMSHNLRQLIIVVQGKDDYSVGAEHPVYVIGLANDGSLVGFKSTVIWT
ncbi:MAG: hypothetical protein KGS48_01645 [Bacteroidetes bacterium]|nr:hypothetical protein [Bacteroidota bacterium]